jgi:hypothetical protein
MIYGAGGKTAPKSGRLGTGSYWPKGTPIYLGTGNVFPQDENVPVPFIPGIPGTQSTPQRPKLQWGQPSRAGIGTIAGRNLNQTTGINPITSPGNMSSTSVIPLQQPRVVSSPRDGSQPIHPNVKPLQMPLERNKNSAESFHKKPSTYRMSSGAGRSMPVDTAFNHNPAATNQQVVRPLPGYAVEAVKKNAATQTFAAMPVRTPKRGGVKGPHRTPPASFATHGQMWSDPNNSFIAGRTQTTNGGTGAGRWAVVKRGAAGGPKPGQAPKVAPGVGTGATGASSCCGAGA